MSAVVFLDARERICAELAVKKFAEFKRSLTSLYDAIEGNPERAKGAAVAPLTLLILQLKNEIEEKVDQIAKIYEIKEDFGG